MGGLKNILTNKLVQLGDICDLQNGYAFKSEDYSKVGLAILRMSNITREGSLDFSAQRARYYPLDKCDKVQRFLLNKGDVVVAMTDMSKDMGIIGRTAIIDSDCKYLLNQRVGRFIIKDDCVLDNEFLHVYTNSEQFLEHVRRRCAGGLQLNASKNDILSHTFALPSLAQQKRIVRILSTVKRSIAIRRETIGLVKSLFEATFLEIFGDPIDNPFNFQKVFLPEVAQISRGRFSPRPRNDPQFYGGDYPFIQTGDVVRSGLYVTTHSQSSNEKGLKVSKLFPAGTIAITIAANIGETSILTYNTCFPDSVVGLQVKDDRVLPEFLRFQLHFLKQWLISQATQTAQKNINVETLRSLSIILPPRERQDKFLKIVKHSKKICASMEIEEKILRRWLISLETELFWSDHSCSMDIAK